MSDGYYHKYNVQRVDEGNHEAMTHADCDFFVLDLTHDVYAVKALRQYRDSMRSVDPELWIDLTMMLNRYCDCIDSEARSPECPVHGSIHG